MNILILNGNLEPGTFENYLQRYILTLHHLGHYVKYLKLSDFDFSGDDNINKDITLEFKYIERVLDSVDLLIFASPLKEGHFPLLLSNIQERIIKHYQQSVPGTVNALNKYNGIKKIPFLGVILKSDASISRHDLLLNKLVQERIAADLHTILSFHITSAGSYSEAICETLLSTNKGQISYSERSYSLS